jgi:hypothetical protein
VTLGHTASGGSDVSVALYEQLRLHMHAGAAAPGGHCGLVLLRREGMAAWMAWRTTGAAASEPVTARQRSGSAPLAADDLHASLVRVLASLAMSGAKEMSR